MHRLSDPPAIIEFGRFRIFPHRRQLFAEGRPIALGDRAFDLLMALIDASGAIVGKDELLNRVWQGRIVEENRLAGEITALRKAFGPDRELICTVAGRGYQFTGEIRICAPGAGDGEMPDIVTAAVEQPGASESHRATSPLPDKPSIAVLPFQNMSGDPQQEYFADGMVDEIITALSRIKWLFVISRNSSFSYKGRAFDVKQVGRELGVRYVLEGSVRRAGQRVRITAQLIDAASGAHLWADRFDGSLEDVFDLQDEVASRVAGVIEPALQAAETARVVARPTKDLTAYDLYMRAHAIFFSSAARAPEALCLFEQAIERDPRYGPALGWAAFCCIRLLRDYLSEDREAYARKGADFARRAIEVASDDPGVLSNAALALAYFGENIGAMMALVDRALALNPNFARGWYISGYIRLWAGQPDVAIDHVETSLRLSPRGRIGLRFTLIGAAHCFSRRFEDAVPKLLLAIQDDPNFPPSYRYLAACYAHIGRLDDARDVIAQLQAVTSLVIPDIGYLRNPEHRELLLSGLRLAAGLSG